MRFAFLPLIFTFLTPLLIAEPSPNAASIACSAHTPAAVVVPKKTSKPKKVTIWKPKKKASTIKKNSVPKVKRPSKSTLASGTSDAVNSFVKSGLLSSSASDALNKAIAKAVKAQSSSAKPTTITHTKTIVSTVMKTSVRTVTHTKSAKKIVATVTETLPSKVTVTVHQIVTATPTSNVTVSDAASEMEAAINSALAATNLAEGGLDNSTIAALQECLSAVMTAGGIPSGYACLTASGSNSAGLQATLNTVLEQFVGILPNTILNAAFDAITPSLTTLLPASEQALITQIEASIRSVIASASGNSVTALEQMEQCYTAAIQQQGNTSSLACFTAPGGPEATLQTAANSIVEQFVGVLPASIVTSVQNILSYNLGNTSTTTGSEKLAAQVQAQISNALSSVASTLSGNAVSLAETLQGCTAILISTGNATAAQDCITSGSAVSLSMTVINGIAQQFSGYLPSSIFSDLVEFSTPLLSNITVNPTQASEAQINAAFDSFFNNATSYGPAYVSCIEQVQECVTNAVENSGSVSAVCPGPVTGCALIKTT